MKLITIITFCALIFGSCAIDQKILDFFEPEVKEWVDEIQNGKQDPTPRDETTLVTIQNGTIQGMITRSMYTNKPLYTYKAIPFAAPPTGSLRFEPPRPALGWDGVLDASVEPYACPQFLTSIRPNREDCLYINIYSSKPANETETPLLPVMVWIHGGGFALGEISYYQGRRLLEHNDMVFVAVQYRLGPFGFLSTGDSIIPGNMGLKDQALALKWIQENIAAFGGDPNQVTVSGESAGAASTVFHLTSPLSQGLFHRAIAMSGTSLAEWAVDRDPWKSTSKLATSLNCSTESKAEAVACLREVPVVDITRTFIAQLLTDLTSSLSVALPGASAVVEGDVPGAFLPADPLELLENGYVPDIPVVLGSLQHEGTLPLAAFHYLVLEPQGWIYDPDYIHDKLFSDLLALYGADDSKNGAVLSQMAALAFVPEGNPRTNFTDIMYGVMDMLSVAYMKAPILRTADILSNRLSSVYLYSAQHKSPHSLYKFIFPLVTIIIGGEVPPFEPGMCHGDDMFFMFNLPVILGPNDRKFSRFFCETLTNVVVHGEPTPAGLSDEYPEWPKYTIDEPYYYKYNSAPSVERQYQDSWRLGMW